MGHNKKYPNCTCNFKSAINECNFIFNNISAFRSLNLCIYKLIYIGQQYLVMMQRKSVG